MSATKQAKNNNGRESANSDVNEEREAYDGGENGAPVRKKQKRNKPTLSCEECVERKTKVSLDFLLPPISSLFPLMGTSLVLSTSHVVLAQTLSHMCWLVLFSFGVC
jgi:hypothetical protein